MARTRNRVQTRERHRKIFEITKGHRGKKRSNIKVAHQAAMHAMRYATDHRRDRKGDFRALWIIRINAAARAHGLTYSRLMDGLKKAGIDLDRKVLAELAAREDDAFAAVAAQARAALGIAA